MSTGISDTPALTWPAGQVTTVTVPVTLPAGRTLADWSDFVLTVREDPRWPRQGADLDAPCDPHGEAWAVALTAAGTPSGASLAFTLTVPFAPGVRRYVLDVVGLGGTAGEVPLVSAVWLSVSPSVY